MLREFDLQKDKEFVRGGGMLVLYGAGEDGSYVANYLDSFDLKGYVFCDSSKRGTLQGHKIISIDDIACLSEYHILLTTRKYEKEIYVSLLEKGFHPQHIFSARNIFPRDVYFEGDFSSWNEAVELQKNMRECQDGYAEPHILEKVHTAIMDVRSGRALFERDSVLFTEPEYFYPLLTSLFYIGSHINNTITILDFGGSLGSTYFQNRSLFQNLDFRWNWCIVEQPSFVEIGRRDIPEITFYESLEEFLRDGSGKDCLLLSGVLQYLPNLYQYIDKFLAAGFEYIIVDRTYFYNHDRFCLEYVPESIYKAVYPAHLADKEKVLGQFNDSEYDIVFKWKNDEYIDLWKDGKVETRCFSQGGLYQKKRKNGQKEG